MRNAAAGSPSAECDVIRPLRAWRFDCERIRQADHIIRESGDPGTDSGKKDAFTASSDNRMRRHSSMPGIKKPGRRAPGFSFQQGRYSVLLLCRICRSSWRSSCRVGATVSRCGLRRSAELLVRVYRIGRLGNRGVLSGLGGLVRTGFRGCSCTVLRGSAERQAADSSGGQKKLLHDSFQIGFWRSPGDQS